MTLTVRSATVTGATTKGSALTHAEMDENFNHLSQAANITVTQSGSGAGTEAVSVALQRLPHTAQYDTQGNYETARAALTGTFGMANLDVTGKAQFFSALEDEVIHWASINADTDHADFTFTKSSAVSNGTRNTAWSWGYNVAASGSRQVTDQPQVAFTIESDFNDGSRNLAEVHLQGIHADGTSFRCWTWDFDHDTNAVNHSIESDNMALKNASGTTRFTFTMGASDGQLTAASGSTVRGGTNNEKWLTQNNGSGTYWGLCYLNDSNELVLNPDAGTATVFSGGLIRTTNNILALYNGTTSQRVDIYGTRTDASNFSRLSLNVQSGGTHTLTSDAAGTGIARPIRFLVNGGNGVEFGTNSTMRWTFNANGHLVAWTDNSYDIGATGATRPRTLYLGTSLVVQAANGQATSSLHAATSVNTTSGATVTATNLIPANSLVLGVTIRVTTLVEGATSISIGDGTDADRWGAGIAVAANTTSNIADFTITEPKYYGAATSVVLTAAGSDFTAGAVRITVHYITLTAATS